ncbi:MAG: hypothetical protein HYX25_04800 [Candidatus Solibacter usitatus]|nr:hypothetical protein [Candidatus Solibacter usitatus]
MTPEDARKLIGGYATGNLADEQRKALFAAALAEQELFDELVREQGLKELLDDPQSRQRLLDELRPSAQRLSGGLGVWRWAAAASLALATVMIAVVMVRVPSKPGAAPVLTAARQPAPTPAPVAAPAAPPAELLRDSVRSTAREASPPAGKAEKKVAEAPAPAALAESVDAVAKSKMANQVAADARIGLRYRILRRDANGVFTETADNAEFASGDAVRVRVEPPAAGILSLSSGGEVLAAVPVEANQTYVLPADKPITLDAGNSETRLTLALSSRADRLEMRQKKAAGSAGAISTLSAPAQGALSVEIVLRHR